MYTRIRLLLLFVPLFLHFFFSHQTLKILVTFFSGTVRSRRFKLGTHVDSGQMYSVYRNQAVFIFLSSYQTLKILVTFFSGTVRVRRFKLGTHVDSGQMYSVYRNQAAAAYLSLYFFILLSLQFSNIKIFRGARWLSGSVSDSGARGRGFETYRRRVVSLSKTLYSPKVLVNYPGSGGSVPTWLRKCWLGR